MRAKGLGWAPYILLLPSLVYMAIFFAMPMLQSFALAFQDRAGEWSLVSIERMLGDAQFERALITTVVLLILVIPIQFVLAMSMALIVNSRLRGSGLWLYVFALPLGISELAAGIIWFSIFTERGWLNSLLTEFGMLERPFVFLNPQEPFWLILAVVLAESWRATAIIMIILVAGLQSIPRDYLEAADVFGATTWQKVRRVILPLLRPALQTALILRTILAFQVFATVLAIAGRGLNVLAAEAYRWYADIRDIHVAASYAGLILLLSVSVTIIYLWLLPTREEQLA
ncbi:sugar ABC transporter permease [soil metagenome]